MYKNFSVAVVVPCYNEGSQITQVLESMPDFVDRIYVVDDSSHDNTVENVIPYTRQEPERIKLIQHEVNLGVGGAISSGYKAARDDELDLAVVMAGDAQMDPDELPNIIEPIVRDECDYTKGNRLFTGDAWNIIPRVRYLGNAALSLLTKIASGYWHITDSQSGYTAINRRALQTIDWDKMYPRYGQPNDLLVRLNIYNFRVRDIPIRPVYGVGEKSGVRPLRMVPRLARLIFRLFLYRLVQKYVIRDFHPLLFFYMFGMVLLPIGLVFGLYLIGARIAVGPVAATSALFAAFLFITGSQFLLFAMWMDMEYNKHLR